MSELDVDLAIRALEQGVDDLLVATRNPDTRLYVQAHRRRLALEIGRLRAALGDLQAVARRDQAAWPTVRRVTAERNGKSGKKRAIVAG